MKDAGNSAMFIEINRMLRAGVPMLVAAFAWIAVPATAFAHTVYDGDWSVLILTRGGACEPSVRYGVQIADGMVINGGGIATVQGRVTRSGTVSVVVRSGNQWASGSGRLARNRGGGAWRGQGTSGARHGTWVAERRE
jgi:hypothetical protein